jgi:hypothetical protein
LLPLAALVYLVMSAPAVSVSRELLPEQRSWDAAQLLEKQAALEWAIGVAALELPRAPWRAARQQAPYPASRTLAVASSTRTPQPREQQQTRL